MDNGCLRKNEAELVVERLKNSSLNINLTVVSAADRFLDALEGVVDPEVKRKTIGRIFIEIFQEEAKKIGGKVRVPLAIIGLSFHFIFLPRWTFYCKELCTPML